jgi:hypothetical protein
VPEIFPAAAQHVIPLWFPGNLALMNGEKELSSSFFFPLNFI